jgi:hypothetical protein
MNKRFTLGGRSPLDMNKLRGMTRCFQEVEQKGDEDEGRAGRVRRRLSQATERAQEFARGLLGRLRRRGG